MLFLDQTTVDPRLSELDGTELSLDNWNDHIASYVKPTMNLATHSWFS